MGVSNERQPLRNKGKVLVVEESDQKTMDTLPEFMGSTMLANTKPTIGCVMPMTNMAGESSRTKKRISPSGAGMTYNEKFVISQGTTTLEPSRNTVVIIKDKADQDHELNRSSSHSSMPPTISLRDHLKPAVKPPDRLDINKGIKINKTFKKQVNAKKGDEAPTSTTSTTINPLMSKIQELVNKDVSLVSSAVDAF